MESSTEYELLNVVDDSDKVIERRTRGEIHRLGLRHRAVHVLIFDSSSRIYLQKRSNHKDVNPGLWDSSAAGHVDAGETYDQCVIRELNEELGIRLEKSPRMLFKLAPMLSTGMEFCQVYRLEHSGPFDVNRNEIEDGCWYTKAQINEWIENGGGLSETFCVIWQALQHEEST